MRFASWLYGLFDMTGADGRPSFTKLVVVSILTWAILADAMNEYIATLVVAAAFGRPTLLAFLNRASLSWGKNQTETLTRREDEDER